MSIDDIKEGVVNLGYSKERIKEMYFSRPDVPFEYSLVPIQSNKEVRELIKLYSESDIVSIYVEHNVDEIDKGKGVLVNEDMDENIGVDSNEEACFLDMYEFNDKYDTNDQFNYNDDDPECINFRKKKKITKEAIAAELEIVRGNARNESREDDPNANDVLKSNAEGADELYKDSDNVDSLIDDSGEDDLNRDKKGKRKKREKITKTYTIRFQYHCQGQGCKWSMWASKCKKELSF